MSVHSILKSVGFLGLNNYEDHSSLRGRADLFDTLLAAAPNKRC